MSSYSLHIKDKRINDGVYTLSLTLSNKDEDREIAEFEAIYKSDNPIPDKKLDVNPKYISDFTIIDRQDIAQFIGYSLSDFIRKIC